MLPIPNRLQQVTLYNTPQRSSSFTPSHCCYLFFELVTTGNTFVLPVTCYLSFLGNGEGIVFQKMHGVLENG